MKWITVKWPPGKRKRKIEALDIQDIIDLGFELVDEIDDNGDMSFQWIENSDLWLTFDKEKIAIGDANGTLFYGKVENKSELKRVIKQVTT